MKCPKTGFECKCDMLNNVSVCKFNEPIEVKETNWEEIKEEIRGYLSEYEYELKSRQETDDFLIKVIKMLKSRPIRRTQNG